MVYVGVGEDPEHGEGVGHLWCIDPTKRGDVSPELAVNAADPKKPIPHKRCKPSCEKKGTSPGRIRTRPPSGTTRATIANGTSDDRL